MKKNCWRILHWALMQGFGARYLLSNWMIPFRSLSRIRLTSSTIRRRIEKSFCPNMTRKAKRRSHLPLWHLGGHRESGLRFWGQAEVSLASAPGKINSLRCHRKISFVVQFNQFLNCIINSVWSNITCCKNKRNWVRNSIRNTSRKMLRPKGQIQRWTIHK